MVAADSSAMKPAGRSRATWPAGITADGFYCLRKQRWEPFLLGASFQVWCLVCYLLLRSDFIIAGAERDQQ
jgi:hypothetical protein